MAKLYYYYGAMGSSKTANALMTHFNYQEVGQNAIININGSENIYLSGMCTYAISDGVVSNKETVIEEGRGTEVRC